MPSQRIYLCPDHPDKSYTSWRKFRGHWSTQHRGQECPPREEFLQVVERETVLEEKREFREEKKERAEVKATFGQEIPRIGENLPEEPVERLATILDVHGIDRNTRTGV